MYSSWASSTWSWPSRVRARRAKMSRINCVRSRTRQGNAASRLRSCVGERSRSKTTRSALVEAATAAISSTFPEPMRVAGSRRGRRCRSSVATKPPALTSSSRNSARDSSALRPGEADESAERSEGDDGAVSGAEPPEGPAPKRSPDDARPLRAARLVGERGSRSTATRTACSGSPPPRPGSADGVCDRPRSVPDLYAPRTNQGCSRSIAVQRSPGIWIARAPEPPTDRCPLIQQPDDARYASRSGCLPRLRSHV